ncbi:ribosome quality control complex subunit NEMF-like isoform X2 [Halichondria panicea]|uniref:ribosome quality control complex subunit NEMF-like isoform X2 n=1 Tax=Halichondria panicea TaxID=6063 RepID=UPI00312B5E75
MKEKFTTIDLFAVLRELRERLLGMRVANVYDIDQKTYLIKLAKTDLKVMLLLESGVRMHTTEFEWPKHMQPSGFAMKLRKHLRTRRLTALTQLGVDRVVDMQFGSDHAAYHVIVELYDRGNVILTDHAHVILSLLRTRTDADSDVRFANREVFSTETAKMEQPPPSLDGVKDILSAAKPGDSLKQVLNPHFVYGSALLTHCILGAGLKDTLKIGAGVDIEEDLPKVMASLEEADHLFKAIRDQPGKGYLVQKRELLPQVDSAPPITSDEDHLLTNIEFHPLLFRQHESLPHKELDTFDRAVDEFFSSKSGQKQDMKAIQVQKTAVKKLDNVRRDHQKRIDALQKMQSENEYKAQLIEMNLDLVEKACLVIRSAVANAMDWGDIELLVKDYQARGDPVASAIQGLKLNSNEITLLLRDPSEEWDSEGDEETQATKQKPKKKGTKVDIDLGLSAYGNATRMYGGRKQAAKKEQKTIDASGKALKSAERKTKQTLKEAAAVAKILKARKVHWFEKFFWFISSENYLVIGGRDQQQNELLVKKYLKEGDLYVHADMHGATSVIIKNPSGDMVSPKTLNEAGHMAVCYSSAWEARIIISAWWVHHHQVSKTAPSGEYLTTGSFMIRGKKNFLPPCQLVLGFGFLFRVDDSCIANHLHERRVKAEDELSMLSEAVSEVSVEEEELLDEEGSKNGDEDEGSKEGQDEGSKEGQDEGSKEGQEDESEEEDFPWPDTTIAVAHISGGRYELQRGVSVSSSHVSESDRHLSMTDRQDSQDQDDAKRHQHVSAKQRREMKKQRVKSEPVTQAAPVSKPAQKSKSKVQQPPQPEPPQSKRGQKSKQKKIREKYGDQDEVDREVMMSLLACSAVTVLLKFGNLN